MLGHEPAGDVISVGPDVESVGEGDRVCLMSWWPCGRCATCRMGRFIQCPNRTSIGGAAEKSVMVDGAFSECMKIPERAVIELDLGAYEIIDPAETDPVEAVRELTGGEGADAVVVAVGSKEAEEQAVGMLRNNGVVSIFAGTYPATTIEVDPNDIHYTEKVVTGAFAGSPEQFTRAVKLISVGLVDVEALITHRMPLDNLDEGFEMTLEGVGMKKMILP